MATYDDLNQLYNKRTMTAEDSAELSSDVSLIKGRGGGGGGGCTFLK